MSQNQQAYPVQASAGGISGVTVSGTPSASQVLTATSATAASWAAPAAQADVVSASSPTVNDDSGDGYTVGTRWLNTTTRTLYVLWVATVGAAVWVALGGAASLLVDPPVWQTYFNFVVNTSTSLNSPGAVESPSWSP